MIQYLNRFAQAEIIFAPGARIDKIQPERLQAMLQLQPILHLNDDEALAYTKSETVNEAADRLYQLTHNTVIVTCGSDGAYLKNNEEAALIPGFKADVIDTIGAGDSHIGAWICAKKLGMNDSEAICFANYAAAETVSTKGPALSEQSYVKIKAYLHNLEM